MKIARFALWWVKIAMALGISLLFYGFFFVAYVDLLLSVLVADWFWLYLLHSAVMSIVAGCFLAFVTVGRTEPWILTTLFTNYIVLALVALFHLIFEPSVFTGLRGIVLQLLLLSALITMVTYRDPRFSIRMK